VCCAEKNEKKETEVSILYSTTKTGRQPFHQHSQGKKKKRMGRKFTRRKRQKKKKKKKEKLPLLLKADEGKEIQRQLILGSGRKRERRGEGIYTSADQGGEGSKGGKKKGQYLHLLIFSKRKKES